LNVETRNSAISITAAFLGPQKIRVGPCTSRARSCSFLLVNPPNGANKAIH
jgi:hypothetical protein